MIQKNDEPQVENEIPTFEGDDLFKAMRVCVVAMGVKNKQTMTATLAIPAKVIKETKDEAQMSITYDQEADSFIFRVPIKMVRKRGIVTPSREIIRP